MRLTHLNAPLAISYGGITFPRTEGHRHFQALLRELDLRLMAGEGLKRAPNTTEQRAHEGISHQSDGLPIQNACNRGNPNSAAFYLG